MGKHHDCQMPNNASHTITPYRLLCDYKKYKMYKNYNPIKIHIQVSTSSFWIPLVCENSISWKLMFLFYHIKNLQSTKQFQFIYTFDISCRIRLTANQSFQAVLFLCKYVWLYMYSTILNQTVWIFNFTINLFNNYMTKWNELKINLIGLRLNITIN